MLAFFNGCVGKNLFIFCLLMTDPPASWSARCEECRALKQQHERVLALGWACVPGAGGSGAQPTACSCRAAML